MAKELTQNTIIKALDYCYDRAVSGVPGLDTAQELAESYLHGKGSLKNRANSLVNHQVAKAGASGFLTGLGGLITLPLSVPANISSVLFIQLRMVAAIAYLGGHDIHNDKVRTLAYVCLCGSAASDLLKDIGVQVGIKLTRSMIQKISGATITKINQTVGFRLLTKFGQTGLVNLGKALPLIGGIVGGGFDAGSTKIIGKVAVRTFIEE